MWLEFVIEASNEHRGLQQTTPKIYNTAFKMCTPILVTKLERVNGYAQFRANQKSMGMILVIRGVWCDYNSKSQDMYAMMQATKRVTLFWKLKDQINDDYKKVF